MIEWQVSDAFDPANLLLPFMHATLPVMYVKHTDSQGFESDTRIIVLRARAWYTLPRLGPLYTRGIEFLCITFQEILRCREQRTRGKTYDNLA